MIGQVTAQSTQIEDGKFCNDAKMTDDQYIEDCECVSPWNCDAQRENERGLLNVRKEGLNRT